MFEVIPVPALDDNYIWLLRNKETPFVVIVDPGTASPVLDAIKQYKLTPVAILITHHHADHVAGVEKLVEQFKIPVYGPASENIPAMTHPLKEGDKVIFANMGAKLDVLDIPGHTSGHIAYYGHHVLFCGDTVFSAGSGRLFEGTADQMVDSIDKIRKLPDNTLLYCAHEYTAANLIFAQIIEPNNNNLQQRVIDDSKLIKQGKPTVPSTLMQEKQTNPFLRWDIPSIQQAAEQFCGKKLLSAGAVFAVIRHWKDSLD